MKSWLKPALFVVVFIVVVIIARQYQEHQRKDQAERSNARSNLRTCVLTTTRENFSKSADLSQLTYKSCDKFITQYRSLECARDEACDKNISAIFVAAQKRVAREISIKEKNDVRAKSIQEKLDKLGMTEDQLYEWFVDTYRDDLRDQFRDEMMEELRNSQEDNQPEDQ